MHRIDIRAMEAEDYSEVLAFWKTIDGIHLHHDKSETKEGFAAIIKRNPKLSSVAVIDEKIVGASLCCHDGMRAFIHHLAVDRYFRGKGIARKLVERSLAELESEGIGKFVVAILKSNSDAQSFWQHMGFEKIDIIDMYAKT